MPIAAPCTCSKKCRSRSSSVVFLGLFLLSLTLHAVTLVCYLDLRSQVKREIIHQKRDSVMTLAGSDLADPAEVLSLSHPVRLDSGSSRGGESREVKKNKDLMKRHRSFFKATLLSFLTRRLFVFIHLRSVLLFPVSRCQVLCLRCYGMFLGNFFYSSLSRRFISSVSRQVCFLGFLFLKGWICAPVCVIPPFWTETR